MNTNILIVIPYWKIFQAYVISTHLFYCVSFNLSPGVKEGKKYKLFSAHFGIILFPNVHCFGQISSENFSTL